MTINIEFIQKLELMQNRQDLIYSKVAIWDVRTLMYSYKIASGDARTFSHSHQAASGEARTVDDTTGSDITDFLLSIIHGRLPNYRSN